MQKAPRNVKLKAMHLYSPLSLESLTSDVALKFMMIADINHKAANTHVPIIIVVVESVIKIRKNLIDPISKSSVKGF